MRSEYDENQNAAKALRYDIPSKFSTCRHPLTRSRAIPHHWSLWFIKRKREIDPLFHNLPTDSIKIFSE